MVDKEQEVPESVEPEASNDEPDTVAVVSTPEPAAKEEPAQPAIASLRNELDRPEKETVSPRMEEKERLPSRDRIREEPPSRSRPAPPPRIPPERGGKLRQSPLDAIRATGATMALRPTPERPVSPPMEPGSLPDKKEMAPEPQSISRPSDELRPQPALEIDPEPAPAGSAPVAEEVIFSDPSAVHPFRVASLPPDQEINRSFPNEIGSLPDRQELVDIGDPFADFLDPEPKRDRGESVDSQAIDDFENFFSPPEFETNPFQSQGGSAGSGWEISGMPPMRKAADSLPAPKISRDSFSPEPEDWQEKLERRIASAFPPPGQASGESLFRFRTGFSKQGGTIRNRRFGFHPAARRFRSVQFEPG